MTNFGVRGRERFLYLANNVHILVKQIPILSFIPWKSYHHLEFRNKIDQEHRHVQQQARDTCKIKILPFKLVYCIFEVIATA